MDNENNFEIKDEIQDKLMKSEILKSYFSRISLNKGGKFIQEIQKIEENSKRDDELSIRKVSENNQDLENQNFKIEENEEDTLSITNNLTNIIAKLLRNAKKDVNVEQFELLGEFIFSYHEDYKPFFEWVKNKNINLFQKSESKNISEEPASKYKPIYFLIYYRIYNNVVDIILHDNTLIKNTEMEALENETKKKILSKIAHEFKTPLNTIIGQISQFKDKFLSSIKEGKDFNDKENQKVFIMNLDTISHLSNYSVFLIRDLMQFLSNEKIESIQVEISKVNLRHIVKFGYEILKTLLSMNEVKKNRVETLIEYDDIIDHIDVLSDETRLNQIILNLVSNAVKFTNVGFIKVSCQFDHKNDQIIIKVEDTGSGIRDEQKELVFDDSDGRQIDLQYQLNKMGSGYGLKISYNISKKLNHILDFNSEFGQGTTFFLKIFPNIGSLTKGKYKILEKSFKDSFPIVTRRSKSSVERFIQENKNLDRINPIINCKYNINNLKFLSDFNENTKFTSNKEEHTLDNMSIFERNIQKNYLNKTYSNLKTLSFLPTLNNLENINFKKPAPKKNKSSIEDSENSQLLDDNSIIVQKHFKNTLEKDHPKKKLILIIDDNQMLRGSMVSVVKKFLNKKNLSNKFEILEGNDGKDLMKYVFDDIFVNNIEFIITDENMEIINGSTAVKFLRETETKKFLKKNRIILASSENFSNFKDIGFDYSLNKPIRMNELENLFYHLAILEK